MSWSLEIKNGDLALRGASLGQVTGGQKLVQDLRCAILESRGHDDHHPEFGSLIDGGTDESGQDVASVVASSNINYVTMRVQSEIRRIATAQQRRQLARSQADRYTYGSSTLDNGELLVNVAGIEMTQIQDTLLVRVNLQVGNGQTVSLNIPVNDVPISV